MGLFDMFKPIPDKEIEGLHLPEKPKQIVDGEEVVSVWEGSGNQKFHQRRYFDGYTQYETLGADGKTHRHNVYVGYWYIQQLTKEQRRNRRIIYILLFVIGMGAMCLGCTRTIPANTRWFAAIPEFAALFGFLWIAVAIFNEFCVPQKRTIGDYRASSLGLKRGGMVALISSALSFLITLIYAIIGKGNVGLTLLAAAMELAAAAAAFLVWWLERKVVYKQERSKDAGKFSM